MEPAQDLIARHRPSNGPKSSRSARTICVAKTSWSRITSAPLRKSGTRRILGMPVHRLWR